MSILTDAEKLVNGERQEQYDDPLINFKRISDIASALCGFHISMRVCCCVLIAVKFARAVFKYKEDNYIDAVGYVEILNRIVKSEEK